MNDDKETEKALITPETAKKKNPKCEMIRRLSAIEPADSLHQIGLRLKELGILSNERSIYKIVQRDEELQRDIREIRQFNAERLSRNLVPLALKVTERALKDKSTDANEKFKWAKLSLDKEFGVDERKRPGVVSQINIKEIRQTIYNDMVGDEEPVTIELQNDTDTQE